MNKSKAVYPALAAVSPALALGTASPENALALSVILFVSSCAAIGAVHLARPVGNMLLTRFAAVMIASAFSFGGELIACAVFPSVLDSAPTLAITGGALFFAACLPLFSADVPARHSICYAAAASALVLLLGILRSLFSFLPMSEHSAAGLIAAGTVCAVICIFLSGQRLNISPRGTFMTAITLACAFLLSHAVWLVSDSLWGIVPAFFLLSLFSFVFSHCAIWAITPEYGADFLPAAAVLLTLSQPLKSGISPAVISSIGTALALIAIIAALIPAVRRITFSDAPRCVRGIPAVLLILGIAALAFAGF